MPSWIPFYFILVLFENCNANMSIGICSMKNDLIEFKIIILKKKKRFYGGFKIFCIDIEISIIFQYLIDSALLYIYVYIHHSMVQFCLTIISA